MGAKSGRAVRVECAEQTADTGATWSAKTTPSTPADELIERPSVSALLDRAARRRICVLIGAAGWGKTTAVAAWSRSRPTAWLRYEDHESDADRLLAGLFGALQPHAPVPIQRTAMAGTDQVAAICVWLGNVVSNDLVVVLDDLHALRPGSDAARVVEALCRQAPERLHLLLLSRCELPFSLQRLRGRGLVTEIHAPDLAFDIATVEALLRKTVGRGPPGLPRQVWEHTAGWPAAVHCAVEMLRAVEPDQRLAAVGQLADPGQRFHGYLAEEVMSTAHQGVQQLLRRLAILGEVRFTTEIARDLDVPATALAELGHQGLARRAGREGSWSLVRPLQDFFRHEATPPAPERTALHVTAAKVCAKRGAQAEALRHLLAAGDHAACAVLLIDHGAAMVERGQLTAVLEAADLPAGYLDDPRIQRVLGQAHQVRGQWTQAMQHFQRASRNPDALEPALAWRIGLIAFAHGEFAEVQALTGRTRLERENTLDEIRVLTLSASAYRLTGDLAGLRSMADRARAAARRCGEPRAWSGVYHVLALLAAAEGDWLQHDAHCTDAQRNAEASEDLLQMTRIRTVQAFHQFEAGAPRRALADSQIALSLSEQCESPFLIAHALTTRGRARARLGMLEAAAADFTTAADLFQRIGSRFLAWPLCGLGDLHRTRGQLVRARAAYEEALALAQPGHDVFGLSSALTGLARIGVAADPQRAVELADQAVGLGEKLREVPAFLTRGWVKLMGDDRQGAAADADRAAMTARQRRDNPGLAEAITLGVLASSNPAVDTNPLRDAIDIWQETGCPLEEAATRVVAGRIGAPIASLDSDLADRTLRDYGVDVESRRAAGPLGALVRSAPPVTIQTLGVFRVIRDGIPIPGTAWQSKKARDLLKILVARRRPASRDQLMELLWPGVDPAVAGNRLSVLLSTVRDVLQPQPVGEAPLATTDGTVSLNRAQVSIDVEDFLARATAALDADRANEPDATTRLKLAIDTHTGDFLEDDPYQEWGATLAEEVRATHIALLRSLSARLRDAGDTDAVVRYTLRLLEHDRYDEGSHRELIGVLLDAGRLGEARRHYENYLRRMAEIDVRPSPLLASASRKVTGH